jgi:hypothetical protein
MVFEEPTTNGGTVVTIRDNNAEVEIDSSGGQVSFAPAETEERITLAVQAITEMNNGGFAVGLTADTPHIVSNLSNLNFNTSSAYSDEVNGLSVLAVNLTSPLDVGTANLAIVANVFENDGEIEIGASRYNVTGGSVLVSFFIIRKIDI